MKKQEPKLNKWYCLNIIGLLSPRFGSALMFLRGHDLLENSRKATSFLAVDFKKSPQITAKQIESPYLGPFGQTPLQFVQRRIGRRRRRQKETSDGYQRIVFSRPKCFGLINTPFPVNTHQPPFGLFLPSDC